MKLFYAPHACSIGIHILLEELGLDFEAEAIDLRQRQQNSPEYLAINPKGKVPALIREDGSLLTEFGAIAFWLAQTHPKAGLLPTSVDEQARVREWMDYMIGSIHMRGFAFVIAPQKFTPDESLQAGLRAHGTDTVNTGLQKLSKDLGDRDYLTGTFGIADPVLFYLVHWSKTFGIEIPENLARFYAGMLQRPAVMRVLERESKPAA